MNSKIKFLVGGFVAIGLAFAAWAQLKISQYPNTATLANGDLFIVASGATNKNISWLQLSNLMYNLVPVQYTNYDLSTIDSVRPTNGIIMTDLRKAGGTDVTDAAPLKVNQGLLSAILGDNVTAYLDSITSNCVYRLDANVIAVSNLLYGVTNGAALLKVSTTNFGVLWATNTITRTNNTTAYAVNDAICPLETTNNWPIGLTNVVPIAGGGGDIALCQLRADSTAAAGNYVLWFYSTTNVSPQADNAGYFVYYTNMVSCIGRVPITLTAGTDCAYGAADQVLPFVCASGDKNLYFNLQTLSAITPIANGNFSLKVKTKPR